MKRTDKETLLWTIFMLSSSVDKDRETKVKFLERGIEAIDETLRKSNLPSKEPIKTYKLVRSGVNDFAFHLNEAIKEGWEIEGNITASSPSNTTISLLVSKCSS